jgi:chemotaxis signal transduction protein
MLVIGSQHATWVIQVDAVLGIQRIPGARLLPPPVTVQDDLQCFTRNLAPLGDGTLVSILDLEHLDSAFKAALS